MALVVTVWPIEITADGRCTRIIEYCGNLKVALELVESWLLRDGLIPVVHDLSTFKTQQIEIGCIHSLCSSRHIDSMMTVCHFDVCIPIVINPIGHMAFRNVAY